MNRDIAMRYFGIGWSVTSGTDTFIMDLTRPPNDSCSAPLEDSSEVPSKKRRDKSFLKSSLAAGAIVIVLYLLLGS